MDFQFHYCNTTQANGHLSGRDPCLEFEDVDDQDQDAFYEELRLQVSLLIAAAADDFAKTRQSDKLFGRFPAKLQPGCYFDWCEWDKRDADSVLRTCGEKAKEQACSSLKLSNLQDVVMVEIEWARERNEYTGKWNFSDLTKSHDIVHLGIKLYL